MPELGTCREGYSPLPWLLRLHPPTRPGHRPRLSRSPQLSPPLVPWFPFHPHLLSLPGPRLRVSSPGWAPSPGKAPATSPFPYAGEAEPDGIRRGLGFKGSQTENKVDRRVGMDGGCLTWLLGFHATSKPWGERRGR